MRVLLPGPYLMIDSLVQTGRAKLLLSRYSQQANGSAGASPSLDVICSNGKNLGLSHGGSFCVVAAKIAYVVALAILFTFFCLNSQVHAQSTPESEGETAYELQPYRVRVAVAFDHDPLLTATYRRQVLAQLSSAIERGTGGQWTHRVEETRQIAPANPLGLERITVEDFTPSKPAEGEHAIPPEFDKQFFLTVSLAGSRYALAGREWDELTQEVGPILRAESWERRTVPEELFRLLSELFQPLLVVDEADVANNAISLRLRAGGYVPVEMAEDPEAETLRVQVRKGTILMAFFRYHDKDGSLRQVQMLPWTYLVVDSVVRGRVQATLVTGIRTPLGAKTSKRVHSLAVARRIPFPSTTLQIELRNNPRKKLAGHYISATAEKYPAEEDKTPELFKLTTNRLGRVEIPVQPEHDIVWLRIHSGGALLALVPFAPGLVPELILDLPDDSIRLAVEGDLTQIRARLVDTVARRAALMIRARKAAAEKDWKKVDEEMAKLDQLPSLREFRQQISDIRVKASNDARQQNSRLTERKVREMCEAATNLVDKYLSEERINLLKEEIQESRRTAG